MEIYQPSHRSPQQTVLPEMSQINKGRQLEAVPTKLLRLIKLTQQGNDHNIGVKTQQSFYNTSKGFESPRRKVAANFQGYPEIMNDEN